MVEFNGWVSIWADDEFQNELMVEKTLDYLKTEFPDFLGNVIKITGNRISFNGVKNHRLELHFYPIQVLKWIAKHSSKSYGLIHVLDDEDQREEYHNEFRVWVLKRGVVTESHDIHLSPYFNECQLED